MKIKEIIVNCNLLELIGDKDIDISKVSFDSRTVEPGTMFFAVKGTQTDGHDYIDKALEKGASAIVCEKMPKTLKEGVTFIRVDDSAYVLGVGAANFYGNPSKSLKIHLFVQNLEVSIKISAPISGKNDSSPLISR